MPEALIFLVVNWSAGACDTNQLLTVAANQHQTQMPLHENEINNHMQRY